MIGSLILILISIFLLLNMRRASFGQKLALVQNSPSPIVPKSSMERFGYSSGSAIDQYIYPESDIMESSPTQITLISYDSPESIVDWYKQKVTSSGFSSKNFIESSSNGFISDKITAQQSNNF